MDIGKKTILHNDGMDNRYRQRYKDRDHKHLRTFYLIVHDSSTLGGNTLSSFHKFGYQDCWLSDSIRRVYPSFHQTRMRLLRRHTSDGDSDKVYFTSSLLNNSIKIIRVQKTEREYAKLWKLHDYKDILHFVWWTSGLIMITTVWDRLFSIVIDYTNFCGI